jgi:hypothetical protein
MSALWQATLAGHRHPGKLSVLEVLEAAGDLGLPADSYLRMWETDPPRDFSAAPGLADP